MSALSRVITRAAARSREGAERCELCSAAVPEGHAHVLDERAGEVLCACRACALLFEQDAAADGRYRRVPDRRIRLSGLSPADLGVPVGLAFFVKRPDGGVDAHYPSPLGATRWDVDPDTWSRAVAGCEPLRTIRPSVEALLVNTSQDADEQWLVPIDECYRLVAVVRRHWTGLSGGGQVWKEIEAFFDRLAGR
ncbi:DUF5947 family protein [Thermomonospora echinospora]|uniref:DUF5947 family protein n=1 Tax=Thermomonospora echinospora TaxID=1992 RepID=UPI001F2A9BAD|nr:DUF5947 family protein [Thermomonospora echinospora]